MLHIACVSQTSNGQVQEEFRLWYSCRLVTADLLRILLSLSVHDNIHCIPPPDEVYATYLGLRVCGSILCISIRCWKLYHTLPGLRHQCPRGVKDFWAERYHRGAAEYHCDNATVTGRVSCGKHIGKHAGMGCRIVVCVWVCIWVYGASDDGAVGCKVVAWVPRNDGGASCDI